MTAAPHRQELPCVSEWLARAHIIAEFVHLYKILANVVNQRIGNLEMLCARA